MKRKKILFIQEFSMERMGGGVSIIKRLAEKAKDFNYDVKIACDRSANQGFLSVLPDQSSFYTLPRNIRYGIGGLIARITLFSLDIFALRSLTRLIKKENPDVIHITAHGICFPLMVKAALLAKKKIVISVHDLWFFSVKSLISKKEADRMFSRLMQAAETIYVISGQMQEYLTEEYGKRNYQVVHDGMSDLAITHKQLLPGGIKLLYVGILHGMQIELFNKLVETMGKFTNQQFTIGVCSSAEFRPLQQHPNIAMINYGWIPEDKIKEISREYMYGLLPLSFDPGDELFYRTSLMTKIPFYTRVLLPVVCIGPSSASAIQLIKKENTGLVAESGGAQDIALLIKEVIEQTPPSYSQLVNNLKISAATTFNIERIAGLFYKHLLPEPKGKMVEAA